MPSMHAFGEGFVAFDLLEDAPDGGAFDVFQTGGGEQNRTADLLTELNSAVAARCENILSQFARPAG